MIHVVLFIYCHIFIIFLAMSQFIKLQTPTFLKSEIEQEASRLHKNLSHPDWSLEICGVIAPLTLEINYLKKKRNIIILAHSYQTPDILFGVADFKGDSYYLANISQKLNASAILFAGVYFMAETAKILNPDKIVLISDPNAGCSLSESITVNNIRTLKERNLGIPVITYINTSAEVKAESDIIVTSANAKQIIESLDCKKVIFLPDKLMAQNLQNSLPEIEFVAWDGTCIVHEAFSQKQVQFYREQFGNKLQILVHTECAPEVVSEADMAGGTGDMIRFIKEHPEFTKFMLVTECGLADRLQVEFQNREFIGSCNLCPYMKKITLLKILNTLRSPQPINVIEIPENVRLRALKAIERMFEIS